MLIIQDVLVSDDVVEAHFMCDLNACKGACCWEGDFGAPLEEEEINILKEDIHQIKPFLSEKGIHAIDHQGIAVYYKDMESMGTPLLQNAACAFLLTDESGIGVCGIEKAYNEGASRLKKPISCHLYPIRVTKSPAESFEALNYDRWEICSAACSNGEKAKLPVYQFVKAAIIRKYGEAFYEELEAAAQYMKGK